LIDEDIPALIPAAVIITATFLAVMQAMVGQAVAWNDIQQRTALYNAADHAWEKIGGDYHDQVIELQGYCITLKNSSGQIVFQSGSDCSSGAVEVLPVRVNGKMGRMEVRA